MLAPTDKEIFQRPRHTRGPKLWRSTEGGIKRVAGSFELCVAITERRAHRSGNEVNVLGE
jgi:hypothetical protein